VRHFVSFALRVIAVAVMALLPACSGSSERDGDACKPDDADGIIGGRTPFDVTVDDGEFAPKIFSAQNRATVILKLTNVGSTPHGFTIGCLPTPNTDGCPSKSCFPEASTIAPLDPGEEATATFEVPLVEGLYTVSTGVEGDLPEAQFIVQ
jgi:hypothetical protein